MKKLTIIFLVTAVLVGLTWLWPSSRAAARSVELQGPVMRAHVIDMGQANATLLEFPCGAILIDAGAQEGMEDKLVEFLEDFFTNKRPDLMRTLKSIIITHNHIDHTAALRKVIENFTVERYIDHGMLKGIGAENPNWVRDEVDDGHRQIKIKVIKDSAVAKVPGKKGLTDGDIDPVKCDDCNPDIRVLSGLISQLPAGWHPEKDFGDENNHSIVTRVAFGESTFLFTGDLEVPAIKRLLDQYDGNPILDVDVYHVGHHGSHNGTTPQLLQAMTPTMAIISVGDWDFGKSPKKKGKPTIYTTHAYGHPRRAIIDLLTLSIHDSREQPTEQIIFDAVHKKYPFADYQKVTISKRIYATAWDGNIKIEADMNGHYTVTTSNN